MKLDKANDQVEILHRRLDRYEIELPILRENDKDYRYLRHGIGEDQADRVIKDVKAQEVAKQKKQSVKRDCSR